MFEDLEQTYPNARYKYNVFVLVPNCAAEGHIAGVWHAKKYQAANPSILLHASGSFLCCGIQFLDDKSIFGFCIFHKDQLHIFEHNLCPVTRALNHFANTPKLSTGTDAMLQAEFIAGWRVKVLSWKYF